MPCTCTFACGVVVIKEQKIMSIAIRLEAPNLAKIVLGGPLEQLHCFVWLNTCET